MMSPKSSTPGVTWHRATQKWQASIRWAGVQRYLGLCLLEEDAAALVAEARARLASR